MILDAAHFQAIGLSDVRTISGALADTSKTEIFTPSDIAADGPVAILGLRVVDSTGSVSTALTVHCQVSTNDTERVLDRRATAIDADYAYELEGFPLVLEADGTIDLTGGNGHHWWLAVMPLAVGQTQEAQRG